MRSRLVLVLALAAACGGESRHDLYTRGMKVEGEAERGPCKVAYDQEAGANVLSGDQLQTCLKMQEEALALYEQAAAAGLKDLDFIRTRDNAAARVKRLEGMLKMVREMERPEYKPPKLE